MSPARHSRQRLLDVRPLDRLRSLKTKLGVLVLATAGMAAFLTWIGLRLHLGPRWTFPIVIVVSLLLTQLLARGMTSPLREMTAAARAMAGGDYSRRVRATSADEVGQLAEAFNRMAADLEHADGLRRELVANVSHELRTPIAALQAQLENIVDGVSEPNPATMAAALAQTERLGGLVADLLDLSRVEAGVVGLDREHVDLQAFLDEAADAAALVAMGKDLRIGVDVAPVGLSVPADVERLHQVVANLLHNAIRHSPPDDTIRLVARRAGPWVLLDVVDNGPGIPVAERERVFQRFARGNAPAQGEATTGGTGLGLSIVRWAVTLHRGTVEVVDTPAGCTMRVRLPAQAGPGASAEPPAGTAAEPADPGASAPGAPAPDPGPSDPDASAPGSS